MIPTADQTTEYELLTTLVKSAPIGLGIVDRDLRFLCVNDALAAINGLPVSAHLGRPVAEVLPSIWPELAPMYAAVLRGESVTEHRMSAPNPVNPSVPLECVVHLYPVLGGGRIGGVGIIVSDVTERERFRNELRSRTDLYAMLARANRAIAEYRSREAIFEELCHIAVDAGRFRFAWIGVVDGDQVRLTHGAGDDEGYMSRVSILAYGGGPKSAGPTAVALRTGELVIVNDFLNAEMTAPWHEEARRVRFRASAAVPFVHGGATVAVLGLYSDQTGFFTPELVDTLREMQRSVAFALDAIEHEENCRRDEAELAIALRTPVATIIRSFT